MSRSPAGGASPDAALLATWFSRANEIILGIVSHNLLAAPSCGMLDHARIRGLAEEFLCGAYVWNVPTAIVNAATSTQAKEAISRAGARLPKPRLDATPNE